MLILRRHTIMMMVSLTLAAFCSSLFAVEGPLAPLPLSKVHASVAVDYDPTAASSVPVGSSHTRQADSLAPARLQVANTPPARGWHAAQREDDGTLVFLDWDDTLLCTSYLSNANARLDSVLDEGMREDLAAYSAKVVALLKRLLALGKGRVVIVTNAETGWVQLSAMKFMPAVVPYLNTIKIVSARSTFEATFPDLPLAWKYYAMKDVLQSTPFSRTKVRNIISFGDSLAEREAIRLVAKGAPRIHTKSVKFIERPTLEQLGRELDLVISVFGYIYHHRGDLDQQLTMMQSKALQIKNTSF